MRAIRDAIEHVAVLEHDAYYCDQSHLSFEDRLQVNYDHRWRSIPTSTSSTSGADGRRAGGPACLLFEFYTRTKDTVRWSL